MLLTMLPTVCSQVSPQTVPKTLTLILINPSRNGTVGTHSGNFGSDTQTYIFLCYTAKLSQKVHFWVQLHGSSLEAR